METENSRIECRFKYANNICVLKEHSGQVNVTVRCLADHCKAKLAMSERGVVEAEDKSHLNKRMLISGDIFQLNKH